MNRWLCLAGTLVFGAGLIDGCGGSVTAGLDTPDGGALEDASCDHVCCEPPFQGRGRPTFQCVGPGVACTVPNSTCEPADSGFTDASCEQVCCVATPAGPAFQCVGLSVDCALLPSACEDGGFADAATDSGQAPSDANPAAGTLGAPCTADAQCEGGICLGGAFASGYCSSPVNECDPGGGGCSNDGVCTKSGGVDVDGGAVTEFCLLTCQGPGDCRAGYSCCLAATYSQADGVMECAPPSLCP
jgi:hypothetical protein